MSSLLTIPAWVFAYSSGSFSGAVAKPSVSNTTTLRASGLCRVEPSSPFAKIKASPGLVFPNSSLGSILSFFIASATVVTLSVNWVVSAALVANVTTETRSLVRNCVAKSLAASKVEVIGSGGLSPSLFILPERSMAITTSVGTAQLRMVLAIGFGQVKTMSFWLRPANKSINVCEAVSGIPLWSKIVATTSTACASRKSVFSIFTFSFGRASASTNFRSTVLNCSRP